MEEQKEMNRDGEGNTKTSPSTNKKQGIQCKYWCFTYNNYKIEQIETLEHTLKNESDWYVFQEETGENGTPHLQGTICFKKRLRLTELKCFDNNIHWEKTKAINKAKEYCTKTETRTGKIYTYNIDIPEEIEIPELYGWQLTLLEVIKQKPTKRIIYWLYEDIGGYGKSEFTKYCVIKHDAIILNGKSTDMAHALSKHKNKKLIIIDVPRSVQDYINYGMIEQIKNELVFSGKYDSTQLVFNVPHVIVFSNTTPDLNMMSLDRWRIINLRVDNNIDKLLLDH